MAKQKEAWDKLSMLEKALLIKLSIDNGVSSLKLIRDTYNLYANGGNLAHKYDGNTEETSYIETTSTPTKELYITQQLDSIRNNALERSRNKTQDETTNIYDSDVYGKKYVIDGAQELYNMYSSLYDRALKNKYKEYKKHNPLSSEIYSNIKDIENDEVLKRVSKELNNAKNLLEDAKNGKYNGKALNNCIANLSEMFPHGLPYGNQTFKSNPEKYGFSLIDTWDVEPGDLVQRIYYDGTPYHAMIYNGIDEKGKHTFNYSDGNEPYVKEGVSYGGYKSGKHYPSAVAEDGKHLRDVNVYRYTGTSQDSIQWSNEWELLYRTQKAFGGPLAHKKSGEELGEGQDLNYPNGVIRQGKLDILKKIVQSPVGAFTRFIDPTGILSIPDAYYDLKHLVETPTTQRTTADYVDAGASIVGLFPLGNNISDFVKVKNWRQGLQLANKYAEHLPFKLVGVYPDMYLYHNQKSTGGPLYPFSFEKNPFLKTPVVRYDEGGFFAKLFGKKDTPPTPEEIKADRIERFINDTWETEYSVPRGYDSITGLFYPYKSPEGGTKTIGPGFKLRADGSGDATMFSAKEAAKGVTREQINEKLRAQGELQYDKVLEFLNQKGNRLPVDTINPNIMNGLMDLRFLVGALGGWDNLREAVLNGDLESIKKESLVTFKDGDTGKIKPDVRRNELRAKKFWHYD